MGLYNTVVEVRRGVPAPVLSGDQVLVMRGSGGSSIVSCSGYHPPHDSLSPDSGVVFTCIPSRGSFPPSPSHQEAFLRAASCC